MARWRRRYKRFHKQRTISSSSSNNSSNSNSGSTDSSSSSSSPRKRRNAWTWRERPQVLAYLQEYRARVVHLHHNRENNNHDSLPLLPLPPTVDVVVVGTIELPALTNTVLGRPYLKLPSTLSGKQRKMVHECCVEADLYHATVSRKDSSRTNNNDKIEEEDELRHVVVSIYEDGFDSIPDLQNNNQRRLHRFAPHQYHPWVCQRQRRLLLHDATLSSVSSSSGQLLTETAATTQSQEESIARRKIEALIDQPGDCLRDNNNYYYSDDILDMEHAQNESLADTTPPTFAPDEWLLVDTPDKLHQCIQELQETKPSFLAFDLEAHNPSKYAQLTCLLQLTTQVGKEYVIDTLAPGVWEQVYQLAPFFGDASIVKIGHSIGGLDVQSLHRDFGIFVVNAFDTYEAAKVLHLPAHGLAKVCEYYGLPDCKTYATLKAEYQACDWTIRPLTEPMLLYGRYDIHYLIQLRRLMIRDLTREAWNSSSSSSPATMMSEAHLVANALAETLKQFEDEDNGAIWDDYDDEMDYITELDSDCENDEDEPDETDDRSTESFKTSKMQLLHSQSNFSDDDASFVTSKTSLSLELANPSSESFEKSSNISNIVDTEPFSKLDVPVLRMQPDLMRVLSYSQERCLRLWKSRVEPHLQNSHFTSLIHRARRNEVDWTVAKTHLYNNLVEWRERVAVEMECLPPFILPLEFLVSVALKRPTTEFALRKIAFHLPVLLEENATHRQQVISIILSSYEETPTEEETRYYFSNSGIDSVQWNGTKLGNSSDKNVDALGNGNPRLAFKICAVGALLAATAFVVTNAWRRKR